MHLIAAIVATALNLRRTEEKEIQRWLDTMDQSRQVMSQHAPGTKLWFQLDREGDAWPILQQADQDGHWFTIRENHNRRVILADGRQTYLRSLLAQQLVVTHYELQVSGASRRTERVAKMVVQTCNVTLDFRNKRTKEHFSKQVNVVLAREQGTTPSGEKPIEWLLLTNRPVATVKNIKQIVFGYAQRWRIEDFHRTWKSGTCRVEESQLRSAEALTKWATILAAVAVRAERISVSRLMPPRPRKPPSQTWRTFLDNHLSSLASIDFFVVPTATFRVLYVFLVLAHDRRRVMHFNVTEHPSAQLTAQQIVEAFPEDTAPKYMIRDRDGIYGDHFRRRVRGLGIEEVLTPPQSPWQSPYVERLVGSV